jgi:hypothetical protein
MKAETLELLEGADFTSAQARAVAKAIEQEIDAKRDVLATKSDLAEVKSDIIKWMFLFWLGTVCTFLVARFAGG